MALRRVKYPRNVGYFSPWPKKRFGRCGWSTALGLCDTCTLLKCGYIPTSCGTGMPGLLWCCVLYPDPVFWGLTCCWRIWGPKDPRLPSDCWFSKPCSTRIFSLTPPLSARDWTPNIEDPSTVCCRNWGLENPGCPRLLFPVLLNCCENEGDCPVLELWGCWKFCRRGSIKFCRVGADAVCWKNWEFELKGCGFLWVLNGLWIWPTNGRWFTFFNDFWLKELTCCWFKALNGCWLKVFASCWFLGLKTCWFTEL